MANTTKLNRQLTNDEAILVGHIAPSAGKLSVAELEVLFSQLWNGEVMRQCLKTLTSEGHIVIQGEVAILSQDLYAEWEAENEWEEF